MLHRYTEIDFGISNIIVPGAMKTFISYEKLLINNEKLLINNEKLLINNEKLLNQLQEA